MRKPLLLITFIGTTIGLMAQTAGDETSVIKAHFSSVLAGEKVEFKSDATIASDEIATARQQVWEAWQQANNEFDEKKLGKKIYSLDDNLTYQWPLPADLEPSAVMPFKMGTKGTSSAPYPLIVILHGSGAKDGEWAAVQSVARSNDDAPSCYFIPQIPNGGEAYGGIYYRWWHKSKQWAWEKLIRQFNLRDDIDNNRFYFIGISEGAYGSQRLGSYYADYLAGIGPMAGGEPLPNAPCENLRNTAVHFRTGSLDVAFHRSDLTTACSDSLDRLQSLYPDGYVHDIKILEGYGHSIPYSEGSPWLVKQVRNPWPKHVNWEDYEMDGNHRNGFNNIQVLRRCYPDYCTRTYYEMDIEDNNIDIRVRGLYYETLDQYDNPYDGNDLVLNFRRHYKTATGGAFRIYLNNELVDLSREVSLTVNGKELFRGTLQPNLADMVNSCALYFDRDRVFPASIDVDLDTMSADGLLSGISDITVDDSDIEAPVEYFNLQGIKVTNPSAGIYIRRQGSTITKVVIN